MLGYEFSDAGSEQIVKLENTNRSAGNRITRQTEDKKDIIPIEETYEDLATFKKPESNNEEYRDFINFLYRKDSLKPEGQREKRETSEKLEVSDSPDEFYIPKPSVSNQEYDNFIKELYRFDKDKKVEKVKREIGSELINIDDVPEEFEYKKPSGNDKTYDDFIDNLYKGDKIKTSSKVKRDVGDQETDFREPSELFYETLARDLINSDGDIFDAEGIKTNKLDAEELEDSNPYISHVVHINGQPARIEFRQLFVDPSEQTASEEVLEDSRPDSTPSILPRRN